MSKHQTFLARALAGTIAKPDIEIYAEADAWHDAETSLSLHEWLGMTWPEYERWAKDSRSLSAIVAEHRLSVASYSRPEDVGVGKPFSGLKTAITAFAGQFDTRNTAVKSDIVQWR